MNESTGSSGLVVERIATLLREEILSGRLAPGAPIRQESVAREHGSSRLPVREALRMLESQGLVTLRPNAGARVASMNLDECVAIYKIREQVEPLAFRESIPNITAKVVDQIDDLVLQMENLTDRTAFPELDRAFHRLTYSGCNITFISDLIEKIWDTTQHYRRLFAEVAEPSLQWIVHVEHRLIVDAVKRVDLDEGANVLNTHLRRTRHELERHPELFDPRLRG